MSTTAKEMLDRFTTLSPQDQQQVAVEILRRTAVDEFPDDAFNELAADLFRGYDAEESARVDP